MKLVTLINDEHEDEQALYNVDKEEVVLKGDYDNDKIESKIEGFIECLTYLGIQFEFEDEPVWVEREDKLFDKCNFY